MHILIKVAHTIIAWHFFHGRNFTVFCAAAENESLAAPVNLTELEIKLQKTILLIEHGFYSLDFKVNRLLNESIELKYDRCVGTEKFAINSPNNTIKIYQSYGQEGTFFEPMTVIPPLIQATLTEITLNKVTVDLYETFLPSIQYACNLEVLNLKSVRLANWILNNPSSGGSSLVEIYLPKLHTYTISAEDRRSGMFKSQLFPFNKGSITSKWDTNIHVNFDYQQSKLIIEPEIGKLTVVRYSAHVIDKFLPNLNFDLIDASFQQCEFTSLLPQSLKKLSLIKTFPGRDKISEFFKDLINLEFLSLHIFGKVNIEDLPKSLEFLSIAYAEVLISPDSVGRNAEDCIKFSNLQGIVLNKDAIFNDKIIDNFTVIFPNLKKLIVLSNTQLIPTILEQPNVQKVLCDATISQDYIGTPHESYFQSCNPGGKLSSGYCNLYRNPLDGNWIGNHLSFIPDIITY